MPVTNYDAAFTWTAVASAGSASIDTTGVVTVTGLAPGETATVTVTTTRTGYDTGTADATGSGAAAPGGGGTGLAITKARVNQGSVGSCLATATVFGAGRKAGRKITVKRKKCKTTIGLFAMSTVIRATDRRTTTGRYTITTTRRSC